MLKDIINNLEYSLTNEKKNEIYSLNFDKNIQKRYDLTGKKFNHLTVLGKGPSYVSPGGHKQSQWWCICDCDEHNLLLVRNSNLTNSNTKSCGCQNTESRKKNMLKAAAACRLDITGNRYGELIALKPTDERKGNSIVWECLCSCGRIHKAAVNELNAHRVESCGCNHDSRGIRRIKQILNENKIIYETEKTFKTCKFPDTQASARFDFYINNEFLLEYDGIQHFEEKNTSYFKDSLSKRQEHDKYKNQWCKENNIILKRIPYTELNNLSLESIMGDKYLC